MAPALDALAADPEEAPRVKAAAERLREISNGYAPVQFAADELERIVQLGAGVLRLRAPELLGAALEVLHKLHREPASNRQSRRRDAALEERQKARLKRSARLQQLAGADGSLH